MTPSRAAYSMATFDRAASDLGASHTIPRSPNTSSMLRGGIGPAEELGQALHDFARALFPICRSITGQGVRRTLSAIQDHIPIAIYEVPSGTPVFDWVIPREWNVHEAYVVDPRGRRILDVATNNLHLVGYSTPVRGRFSLAELQEHLYSLEDQPDAVPYVTSYYEERWGFCLAHHQRVGLEPGEYEVVIDSELRDGSLTYGELLIPGESTREVFLSTYVCHPSMANNELSGPVVATWLAKWLQSQPRHYTYRLVFIPETIGSLTYLSTHLDILRRRVVAGFNLTCLGDERAYSFLPSRTGGTLADRVALNVLESIDPGFVRYTYLDRGSDERQYCSPGVDLPLVSVMRTKYGAYAEYHTSLDDLSLITPRGLAGGFEALRRCLELLESNLVYRSVCTGEPNLGKRGLYPTLGSRDMNHTAKMITDFLSYADGTNDLIEISNIIGVPAAELYPLVDVLLAQHLIEPVRRGSEPS